MPPGQLRVLGNGARITGGVLSILLLMHTVVWLVRDIAEYGIGRCWDVWTGTWTGLGDVAQAPATSSVDLPLLVLQLAAAYTALSGLRAAGGLLASTAALTFGQRLPVIWHEAEAHLLDTPSGRWAALSSGFVVLLTVILGIVLLAGLRPWTGSEAPKQAPPQRPTRPAAVAAAVILVVWSLFQIGWIIQAFTINSPEAWWASFTGRLTVPNLMGVPPACMWLLCLVVFAVGAGLAMGRRVSARGFALGAGLTWLTSSALGLVGALRSGSLFAMSGTNPGTVFFSSLHIVVSLIGAVVLVLMCGVARGEPAQAPMLPGQPPYGVGGYGPYQPYPPQPPQPYGAPQPYAAPQPYGAPPPQPDPNSGPAYGYPPTPPQQPAAPPVPPQAPPQIPPQPPQQPPQ